MARRRRAVLTRAQARAKGFTRLQTNNAGTVARPVKGHVLGPENQNVWELEGGVKRPKWLTPKKPLWAKYLGKGLKYGGIAGLVAGSVYDLYQASKQLGNYKKPTPLRGYLDKVKTTTMAPVRMMRKKMKYATRKRTIRRRRYRRRAVPRRRYGRRRFGRKRMSPLQKAIRRSTKRIKMYHYKNPYQFARGCDVIHLRPSATEDFFKVERGWSTGDKQPKLAKYYNLKFFANQLPNLQEKLNATTFEDFTDVKIDKVIYKITVMNARALAMDPNFRVAEGTGQNAASSPTLKMIQPEEYVRNSYVFHRRYDGDAGGTILSRDFDDWSAMQHCMKGAVQYVSFFRQKGKMFNTGVYGNSYREISTEGGGIDQKTSLKKQGVPLGWVNKNTTDINKICIGRAGLILPSIHEKGWDNTTDNLVPHLMVQARVCWSVRNNAYSIDDI